MSGCEDRDRFLDGQLDEPAAARFAAHARECAACAARGSRAHATVARAAGG